MPRRCQATRYGAAAAVCLNRTAPGALPDGLTSKGPLWDARDKMDMYIICPEITIHFDSDSSLVYSQ